MIKFQPKVARETVAGYAVKLLNIRILVPEVGEGQANDSDSAGKA